MLFRRPTSSDSRQILPVWCGIGLGKWLQLLGQRPPLHWTRIGRVALISAAACLNSPLSLLEEAIYGRRIRQTVLGPEPLFVLGHWRSGTTLLHHLLAQDHRFLAPTSYQVSFPGHCRLTERCFSSWTARLLPPRRPMDAMPQRWDLPGEDEIALLLTTLLSPYLIAAFPNESAESTRVANVRRLSPREVACWKAAFLTFLRKVSLGSEQCLLLKSPAHTGRIPLLLELFPAARFVYIVRNPYEVFASTRHLTKVLNETNGLGRAPASVSDERILTTYLELYHAYHLHRALIPAARRYEIRFEDLVADPVGQLKSLYCHFGFEDFEALQQAVESQLPGHFRHRRNVYTLDEATRRTIYERLRPVFERYGYPR